MTNDIVEAGQPMATAAAVIEKKARQLVYDSRYEVKDELKGKKVDPVVLERMILQRISKSKAIPAVIARARQMVSKKASVKEEYISEIQESATNSVANALYKVFVEGIDTKQEEIHLNYLEELAASPDRKYKIRVTDPKTGNSYVRYGTREKITELRGKGLKVELTEYGDPREGERKRGEDTARATGGGGGRKKLDPVGREDADVNNNGKRNDPSDKYIMKRRAAIGDAIEKRKTVSASYDPDGELTEGTISVEGQNKKQITGNNVDNSSLIKVMPQDSSDPQVSGVIKAGTEFEGEVIAETGYSKFLNMLSEKSVSISQQQAAGAALAAKRGDIDPSTLKGASLEMYKSMTEKQLRDFAKTEHKGLPEKVKEAVEDTRTNKTYHQVIKNKLRSLGDKNPILLIPPEEMEKTYNKISSSDMIKKEKINGMCEGMGLSITASRALGKVFSNPRTPEAEAAKEAQRNLTDPVGFAVKGAIRQVGQALGVNPDKNKQMIDKRRPQTPLQKQVATGTQQVVKQSYEPEGEVIDEIRRSEKEGKGSPERREGPYLIGARQQNRERGEKGGRRWVSGGEGGSRTERGRSKGEEGSQESRMNPPETTGKYLNKQERKRGSEMGSRFD